MKVQAAAWSYDLAPRPPLSSLSRQEDCERACVRERDGGGGRGADHMTARKPAPKYKPFITLSIE